MNLFEIINRDDYEAALEANLITVRDDGGGLRILNYSSAAIYTPGAWDNAAVRVCRGLIVDSEHRVIARPWEKFFNHGQAEAGELELDAPVEVTDKMDGSLGVVHWDLEGIPRVASRGSFASGQAIHGTAVLQERYAGGLHSLDRVTPLVEIIFPENRIVVDYGERDDLVLLGGVHIETGAYLGPGETADRVGWGGPQTTTFEYATFREALATAPRPGMEGLCVRWIGVDRIVKLKQSDYVELHRIVTGLSERSIWERLSAGGLLEGLLDELPDELHPWTRDVWTRIDTSAREVVARARLECDQIVGGLGVDWTRRDFAQAAAQSSLRPYLFQILDQRDPYASVLRTLKPAGDIRAKPISEDVA